MNRSLALARVLAAACLLVFTCLLSHTPVRAQETDGTSGGGLADERIAAAEMFLADSEWDAALYALEEASWYVTDGDPQHSKIRSLRKKGNFGKYREKGDDAEAKGDLETAIKQWERALSYGRDSALRSKVERARATLEPDEVTPEEITPEDVTPEEITPEDVTPEEITPEDVTPEDITLEDVTPGDITLEDVTAEDVTPEDVAPEDVTPEDVTPEDVTPAVGDGTGPETTDTGGLPWIWIVGLVVLVALVVVGTRPPVLAAIAGGMVRVGWHGAALTLYERLVARGTGGAALRLAHVRCLAALGKTDAEARGAYRSILDEDAPSDLVLHLAALYWEHGFVDREAPLLYELATNLQDDDPDLWEALDACLVDDDHERRLAIARRLLDMGRPSPERLLMVAEEIETGEPDERARTLIKRVAALTSDDEDVIERKGALLDRLLPVYQEFELEGEDAIVIREALLFSVARQETAGGGHRMTGPRSVRARAILAELARLLRRAGQPERLFDVYVGLLTRFGAETSLLDGLLRTAGELGTYSRALAVVAERYSLADRGTDPSMALGVAAEFMVAGSRHLRERAHESGTVSADLPSLTFFERARAYVASVDPEDAFRPDVREQLKLFLDLYLQADDHLLALDSALTRLLWSVGEYPSAVALFLWSCGFEPHIADKGVLLVPSDSPPPCEELFPEERSTLVAIVADRPLSMDDVDALSAKASGGVFNARMALMVTAGRPSPEIRQRAATRPVPVITMDWSELAAALEAGHPRQTFRRHVRGAMQYSVPPGARAADLEDARLFGRDALMGELGERFATGPTERMLVISGVRGVGKSTLWSSSVRASGRLPAAALRPDRDPDIHVPGLWLEMLDDLFTSARGAGFVEAPTRAPRLTPEPAADDEPAVYQERFERILSAMDGQAAPRVVLAVDRVDDLFPIADPMDSQPELAEGGQNVLDALAEMARGGNVSVALLSRQVGASSSGTLGGTRTPLPDDCDEVVVGLLEDDACHSMLTVLASDLNVELPDDVRHRLAEACGGHPLLCWMAIDTLSAHRSQFSGMLEREMNELVLARVLGSVPFGRFAGQLMADFSAREQDALQALARAAAPGTPVTVQAVAQACEALGRPLDAEPVLDGLTRTTLVVHAPPDGYLLRVGLLKDWLGTR